MNINIPPNQILTIHKNPREEISTLLGEEIGT
jgi:hypothetical protein